MTAVSTNFGEQLFKASSYALFPPLNSDSHFADTLFTQSIQLQDVIV